jgi:hypothetical protein
MHIAHSCTSSAQDQQAERRAAERERGFCSTPGQQQLRSFPFGVTMPMHIKEGGTSTRNTLGGTLRRGRTPRVYPARKKSAVPRCHPRPLLRSPR